MSSTGQRFIVTELEGYMKPDGSRGGSGAPPGLSCTVLDTAWNYRIMRTWRTEDYGGTHESRRALVRHRAATLCAELNGEPVPTLSRYSPFRPSCPRCGRKCDPDAAYCKCGKNLYRQEVGH